MNRDISPRTQKMAKWRKEKCQKMNVACKSTKQKLVEEIEVLDGGLQSRWDTVHGKDGGFFPRKRH